MEPRKAFLASSFWLFLIIFLAISLHGVNASSSEEQHHVKPHVGPVVERDKRRTLFDTEYGEISSIDIMARHRAPPYHLQFFTLEPNSVFLPVLLHANMVLYVHTGSGRLTWADEHGSKRIDLRKGDLFKLNEGSVFYVQSNLEAERNKLRIYAMFANTDDTTYDPSIGAYSRINQLVKGFDKKIIQAAFNVPEDLIETITNKTDTPAIVHANSKEHKTFWELEVSVLNNFLGIQSNGKKGKTYNIFDKDPDFKNCHGWSLTVTKKKLKSLKGTNTGFLMVNLTTGSMLGPHWNPSATEIAVVIEGEGMVRVVSGSSNNNNNNYNNNEKKVEEDKNMRFKVKEGDVFVVPRFHSMAQMSFNNDSLVFLGFSTAAKENYPQFLAGKRSVLGALDRHIVATSFGVSNTTIDQLFASQDDSIIFGCVSCAEEEERMMQEEIERKKEEEERKREEEEEAREREEEERRREKEEEEEARKREEEEARKQEEERERKREEEEARRQEEARKEEEARREQEQARRQQEERERKEEEEARREKERKRREEEEEEREEREQERARREEEAKREEKEAKKQQEERERKREEEEAKRKQERRREEEQEREQERERKEQEEEAQREQEKARRQQEEREKRREEEEAESEREGERRSQRRQGQREERRGEEAAAQREQEQARRQQEERETRREQEKGREKEEEAERGQGGGRKRHKRGDRGRGREEEAEWEQKEARRQQEERERRRREQQGDEVEVKGNRSSFEGRRVLKVQYV